MKEDKWAGTILIDCPKCQKSVGKIQKEKAEGRTLLMTCPSCGHGFDYEYKPPN